jgi:transmembrane sensor
MQEEQLVVRDDDGPAEQAARWFARLRSPECGPAERRAFEAWLQQDGANRGAYESVARAAARISDALKQDPRLRAMLQDEPPAGCRRPASSPRWRRMSLAAAWVGAIGVALLVAVPRLSPTTISPEALLSYTNSEQRGKVIPLSDGSVLHLDADSQIQVSMSATRRLLVLVSGRAYFEVAKDARRPFSVEAGGTRTVALGTRFEVRLRPEGVAVTLAEGSVAVTPAAPGSQWQATLQPGEQLVVDSAAVQGVKRSVDAARVIAWSGGRLDFDGTPLRQVLADVNRYSSIKVVLGDEALGDVPIGGSFAAGGDAGAFVHALATILPVRSEPVGDQQIVLYPRERSSTAN